MKAPATILAPGQFTSTIIATEDFKRVIKETWENTPILDIKDCQEYCAAHPTIQDNVDFIIDRIKYLKKDK